jgi:hypothetical protein
MGVANDKVMDYSLFPKGFIIKAGATSCHVASTYLKPKCFIE